MYIDNLIIELTRRCNMKCSHCLRGEAQKVDISINTIYNTLRHVDCINILTLGGGENSLKPSLINDLAQQIIWSNCEVQNFYVVTNGKRIQQPFLDAIEKLNNTCSCNEISALNHSNDQYHENIDNRMIDKMREFMFYFSENPDYVFGPKGEINPEGVIAMGNASNWGGRNLDIYKYEIDEGYNSISNGEFYVSYNGDILPSCNLSYNIIDSGKLTLGNVNDVDFSFKKCAEKWNNIVDEFGNGNKVKINEYIVEECDFQLSNKLELINN